MRCEMLVNWIEPNWHKCDAIINERAHTHTHSHSIQYSINGWMIDSNRIDQNFTLHVKHLIWVNKHMELDISMSMSNAKVGTVKEWNGKKFYRVDEQRVRKRAKEDKRKKLNGATHVIVGSFTLAPFFRQYICVHCSCLIERVQQTGTSDERLHDASNWWHVQINEPLISAVVYFFSAPWLSSRFSRKQNIWFPIIWNPKM